MASTDAGGSSAKDAAADPAIVQIGPADLPDLLALSASAHWNQNDADWRLMLALGAGWGIRAREAGDRERVAASIVALPYDGDFGWLSMVLVLPGFQRRGWATRLLRHGVAALAARGLGAVLDATPAGRAVYAHEGFVPTWGFARYRREPGAAAPVAAVTATGPDAVRTRPLVDADWGAIGAIDRPAFGAGRIALLQALAQRSPHAAHVAERAGRVCGFVLGRDGREAFQIGPLVAPDATSATALVDAAIAGSAAPFHIDLCDAAERSIRSALVQRGFAQQRSFVRMVRGRAGAPGDPRDVVVVAGPELG